MNTRKEIAIRFLRILVAISLGIILFPFFENLVRKYQNQIILIFVFSSLIVAILAFVIAFVIAFILKNIKKLMLRNKVVQESILINIIYFILRTLLLSILVIYLITQMKFIWVLTILIGIEVFGFLMNDGFERNK